jgi:hypothetical protein
MTACGQISLRMKDLDWDYSLPRITKYLPV